MPFSLLNFFYICICNSLVAEKTALLRPIELKLVLVALEGCAFRSKFLYTDELMSYCSWFATFSSMIPKLSSKLAKCW
ncbi:hypothetical protein V6Z12_D08G193700 [Gossypium hirsutum]